VVRFGFEHLDLNRIEAMTIVENVRSVRLLERLDFIRASVTREHVGGGAAADHESAVYTLRRSEYDAGRGRPGDPPTAAPAP
jgi:ribosomal-protein-alanine N-acetyltransferase